MKTLMNLCNMLNIKYPILQAGMAGGSSTPDLVAAVSNAGGLGILAASRLTPVQLKQSISEIKSKTNHPFGVNILLAPPEEGNHDISTVQNYLDRFRRNLHIQDGPRNISLPLSMIPAYLDIIYEEKVPVLSVGLGDPSMLVDSAHSAQTRIMTMVTTVEEAIQVAKGGVDIVVAQGAEAGGHRSTFRLGPHGEVPLVGTFALVPQIVDAIQDIPVVAAGGVMDGRGLVAALALGASGILMGTRFMLAKESGTYSSYQKRMLSSTEVDTVVTRTLTGRPARTIRNRFVDEYLKSGPEPLAWPLQGIATDDIFKESQRRNNAEYLPLLAGQGLRLLKAGQDAAEIITEIIAEANIEISKMKSIHLE